MNRIDGGIVQLQLSEVDLGEAVEAATSRFHREHPARHISADVSSSVPEVYADWDRLGQVLDNLLNNADRASPLGVTIRVAAGVATNGQVAVQVIDTGPGIPADQRERVFERFVRAGRPGAGNLGGLGLGLPIVRGLVEAHGGKTWVEDTNSGSGATLTFTLPAVGNTSPAHQ
jgi:signal transduction histidine kinase